MGVINQPFHHKDQDGSRWRGQCFWGVSCDGLNLCSLPKPKPGPGPDLSVVLSSSEKPSVKDALSRVCCPDKLMFASGAGFKILCVIQGLADVYVLSEGSTFKWDSCSPHALLRAMGGGVVDLREALESGLTRAELTYHRANSGVTGADCWANAGGLVAYRDKAQLSKVIEALRGKI
ncbi:hypothetical protein WMY93_011399 [Mugilogobius chulae]|uniref:Inositol polyphosphate 1-phosphatase n=1 Tax=Mugilogobius chulae TaxID=88201 RepID=A0AAW0PEJ0_9GOBI